MSYNDFVSDAKKTPTSAPVAPDLDSAAALAVVLVGEHHHSNIGKSFV